MGFTKEQLLARLKELQIDFSQYQHPVVLTVEAQAKYVGDKGGGLSKNLFLKDKKSRFYIVSALADTKVDLKVLSQRLGLGKGGLRMAPEEALCEILQVPLGCVTPFALINESSRLVDLCKSPPDILHILWVSALSSCDLDKFLRSIGRDPSYIDLEANPPVGKDHPPDLAALVPTDSVSLSDPLENTAPLQAPAANLISSDKKSTTTAGTSKLKAANPLDSVQDSKENVASKPGDKPTSAAHRPGPVSDVGPFVEEILKKLSALLLSEMTEDAVGQHGKQLGTQVVDSISKRLGPDLQSHATMFKNTAYTQGFYAGAHHQPKRL